jgi:tetratricopeptide (TPR) repeat protein
MADVQRYLADEQVQACPPSARYRLGKFARRNKRALAVAGLVLCFLVLLGGGAGWVLNDRSARLATTEREGETALAEATRLAGQRRWPEALAWVQQAEGVLAPGAGSDALRRRVRDLRMDLEMVAKLDEIRLRAEEVRDNQFVGNRDDPSRTEAFREYGIDVKALDPEEAARRIRARAIPVELVMALDDWADERRIRGTDNESQHLSAVARLADADPWRNRLRDIRERRDWTGLLALAASDEVNQLPAPTFLLLDHTLQSARAFELHLTVLRQAQRLHPDDFWINTALGVCLTEEIKPARPQEAVPFFTAAVALRPRSSGAHYNLGMAFKNSGSDDEAIAAYREAIRLKPDYAEAYVSMGSILCDKKREYDGAARAFREAIRLKPDNVAAYVNLGVALVALGKLADAEAACGRAWELAPQNPDVKEALALVYRDLGGAKRRAHDCVGAQDHYAKYLKLSEEVAKAEPVPHGIEDLAWAHRNLGDLYMELEKPAVAREHYLKMLEVARALAEANPKNAQTQKLAQSFVDRAHAYLGRVSLELGEPAAQEYFRKIGDNCNLAWSLATCPDPKARDAGRAVELAKKVSDLTPKDGNVWKVLGAAHYRAGNWKAAIEALDRANQLKAGGDGYEWFYLAMAHWQRDEKDQARKWHDQAVAWIKKENPRPGFSNGDKGGEQLRRLRDEAAALLGVKDPPPPPGGKDPPKT